MSGALDDAPLADQLAALHPECWGWALACCRGHRERATEVLHMSYHKILDGRAHFDGRAAFKTWVFAVIRFTALDHWRSSLRRWWRFTGLHEAPDSFDPTPHAAETLARQERCAEVRAALDRLSPRQAEVLRLVFYHHLSLDDAARVLGISLGSARTHYERGKHHLRGLLRDDVGAPPSPA